MEPDQGDIKDKSIQMIAEMEADDEDMQIKDKSVHESQQSEFQANQRCKEQLEGHLNR